IIWSFGRPISSARSADSIADWIMASRVTSRASTGWFDLAFSSIRCVSSSWSSEPQLAPMRTGFFALDRGLDDGADPPVLLFLTTHIAGIDAILVERLGAGRVIGQELVADVMEIADDRHVDVHLEEPLLDVRHGRRGLVAVDGDADDLGTGPRQRRHLLCRPPDVCRGRFGLH